MPTVPILPPPTSPTPSPLPSLLHIPSGLAILELQGTIHTPTATPDSSPLDIGQLVFPLYDAAAPPEDLAWTKKVYLYVGKNQRMTGSVKKIEKPLAILKRDDGDDGDVRILALVKWKIVFSSRPEPVGED